jgi:hypothetical protein
LLSRAGISKAKPQRATGRPSGHMHPGRQPQRGADKQRRRCGIPVRLAWLVRSWIRIELRGDDTGGGGGVGGAGAAGTAAGRGSESGRRCASGRGGALGSYRARRGANVGAAELVDGGRRRCARVREGRCVGEERRVGEGRRIGEGPLIGEGHVGDGRGEERRRLRWRKRGEAVIWGKQLSADLEGDGVYIEPPPFVTSRIPNRD